MTHWNPFNDWRRLGVKVIYNPLSPLCVDDLPTLIIHDIYFIVTFSVVFLFDSLIKLEWTPGNKRRLLPDTNVLCMIWLF